MSDKKTGSMHPQDPGDETRGSVSRRGFLKGLGAGGIGSAIAPGAVLEALRSEHLGGAILDVFEREPLDPDDPLWTEPAAVITPHVAAPSEAEPIAREFAANYERFVGGADLAHVVDRSHGY